MGVRKVIDHLRPQGNFNPLYGIKKNEPQVTIKIVAVYNILKVSSGLKSMLNPVSLGIPPVSF